MAQAPDLFTGSPDIQKIDIQAAKLRRRLLGGHGGRVLVVLLVPDNHPPGGSWHIATAWPTDGRTRRVYDGKRNEDG